MTNGSQLKRILIPLDGSALAEQAIPFVAALATAETEVVLLHVVSPSEQTHIRTMTLSSDAGPAVQNEMMRKAAERSASLLRVEPRIEVVEGDPASEIIRAARRHACDLIVAASHGRGAIGRLAFGSVADRLARSSPVPVMLVRPRDTEAEIAIPDIERIVVPYDGSELAKGAFPVAITLARQLDATVHLIRVVLPTVYSPVPTPMEPGYSAAIYGDMLQELETEARVSLEQVSAELQAAGARSSFEVMAGSPFEAIAGRAAPADLIVMTSHGRSGFQRWLLGSVAEKLVREGPVPVVVIPAAARIAAVEE